MLALKYHIKRVCCVMLSFLWLQVTKNKGSFSKKPWGGAPGGAYWSSSWKAGESGHQSAEGRTRASPWTSVSTNTFRDFLLGVLATSHSSRSKWPLPGREMMSVSSLRGGSALQQPAMMKGQNHTTKIRP